jgi:hypothetical protein
MIKYFAGTPYDCIRSILPKLSRSHLFNPISNCWWMIHSWQKIVIYTWTIDLSSISLLFWIISRFNFFQLLLSVIRYLLFLLLSLVFGSLPAVYFETIDLWDIISRYSFRNQIRINLSLIISTISKILAKEQPK